MPGDRFNSTNNQQIRQGPNQRDPAHRGDRPVELACFVEDNAGYHWHNDAGEIPAHVLHPGPLSGGGGSGEGLRHGPVIAAEQSEEEACHHHQPQRRLSVLDETCRQENERPQGHTANDEGFPNLCGGTAVMDPEVRRPAGKHRSRRNG